MRASKYKAGDTGRFPEDRAKKNATGMLRGIQYLHANGIAHRDLKLENFLFPSASVDAGIKIINFGYSHGHLEGEATRNFDTPFYTPPEVAILKSNPFGTDPNPFAVDMWRFGVCIYMMVTGRFPHGGNDTDITQEIAKQFGKANRNFGAKANEAVPRPITQAAQEFMSKLMEPDAEARMNALDSLRHEWLRLSSSAVTKEIAAATKLGFTIMKAKSEGSTLLQNPKIQKKKTVEFKEGAKRPANRSASTKVKEAAPKIRKAVTTQLEQLEGTRAAEGNAKLTMRKSGSKMMDKALAAFRDGSPPPKAETCRSQLLKLVNGIEPKEGGSVAKGWAVVPHLLEKLLELTFTLSTKCKVKKPTAMLGLSRSISGAASTEQGEATIPIGRGDDETTMEFDSVMESGMAAHKIHAFRQINELKRIAMTLAAFHFTAETLDELFDLNSAKNLFLEMDQNGDGVIEYGEFHNRLAAELLKIDPKCDIHQAFDDVDFDHTAKISYTEFKAACLEDKAIQQTEVLIRAFRKMDTNEDGRISKTELSAAVPDTTPEATVVGIFEAVDVNEDGFIDMAEFRQAMSGDVPCLSRFGSDADRLNQHWGTADLLAQVTGLGILNGVDINEVCHRQTTFESSEIPGDAEFDVGDLVKRCLGNIYRSSLPNEPKCAKSVYEKLVKCAQALIDKQNAKGGLLDEVAREVGADRDLDLPAELKFVTFGDPQTPWNPDDDPVQPAATWGKLTGTGTEDLAGEWIRARMGLINSNESESEQKVLMAVFLIQSHYINPLLKEDLLKLKAKWPPIEEFLTDPGFKKYSRVEKKLRNEYGGDVQRVVDSVRRSAELETLAEQENFVIDMMGIGNSLNKKGVFEGIRQKSYMPNRKREVTVDPQTGVEVGAGEEGEKVTRRAETKFTILNMNYSPINSSGDNAGKKVTFGEMVGDTNGFDLALKATKESNPDSGIDQYVDIAAELLRRGLSELHDQPITMAIELQLFLPYFLEQKKASHLWYKLVRTAKKGSTATVDAAMGAMKEMLADFEKYGQKSDLKPTW